MTCTAFGGPLGVGIPLPPPPLATEATAMGALVFGLLLVATLVILVASRDRAR